MQMQMQVQERNQRSVEGRTGTSTIFIIYGPPALLTPLKLPRSFPCTLICSSQPNRMVGRCALIVVLWCLWVGLL